MKTKELMSSPAETCQPQTNVAAVTHMMWDHDCGLVPVVPVVDAGGHVVGVVTDRDICIATSTRRRLPEYIPASEVMTKTIYTCSPDDAVEQALSVMKRARVRRLPVVDDHGHLKGVLSLNDIVRAVGRTGGPTADAVVDTLAAICTPRVVSVMA